MAQSLGSEPCTWLLFTTRSLIRVGTMLAMVMTVMMMMVVVRQTPLLVTKKYWEQMTV